MSLELVKESVRLNQTIGRDSTQTIIENDIIVPDIKPDIVRILLLDGDVFINSSEVAADRLMINGTIRYKILYVSDDPEQPIKSINTSSGFNYAMDIPNAGQGMQSRVKCDIEHMEYEIINSRKINVKAIVSLEGAVASQVEQFVPRDFDGMEDIQILRSRISVNSYIGNNESGCPIKEILELPAGKPSIREILRSDVKVTGKDFKASENKVTVKGELTVSTLYMGDDETRSIQYMEHGIPFAQVIDLPGSDEFSYCNVECEIREMSFEPEEDADGEPRNIKSEIMLNIYAECFGRKDIELIEDAYSPSCRVSLEKENLRMEELVVDTRNQITLKDMIDIDAESPDIQEIFNVLGKLSLSGSEITNDRIILEGVAVCSVLYLANNSEQPVLCVEKEIPFRQSIDVKGAKPGMSIDIDMNIENYSYSMISTKEVEVRFIVSLLTRVVNQITMPVVCKAVEQPLEDKRLLQQPSIIIYFTQPGDTLWKIAKKYYTTIDEIKKDNECANKDTLPAGEQILIFKKHS